MGLNQLKAEVEAVEGLRVVSKVRDFEVVFDEPKKIGGTDQGVKPTEGLISALGACKVICVKAYSRFKDINLEEIKVTIHAESDPDGFARKNPDAKVGISSIKTVYDIKADNTEEEIKEFIAFVESACPVQDTIVNTPELEHELNIL